MNDSDKHAGFFKGFFWGMLLSVPLWLSLFGWLKMLITIFH
ncbi:MAG TPA: hypothetical protein VEV44_10785 [Pseudoneobacillus sp.]|nr:hypothetical protein [Pseudoneobacillus sp.]